MVGLGTVDPVIEAVFEDLEVRQDLSRRLDAVLARLGELSGPGFRLCDPGVLRAA